MDEAVEQLKQSLQMYTEQLASLQLQLQAKSDDLEAKTLLLCEIEKERLQWQQGRLQLQQSRIQQEELFSADLQCYDSQQQRYEETLENYEKNLQVLREANEELFRQSEAKEKRIEDLLVSDSVEHGSSLRTAVEGLKAERELSQKTISELAASISSHEMTLLVLQQRHSDDLSEREGRISSLAQVRVPASVPYHLLPINHCHRRWASSERINWRWMTSPFHWRIRERLLLSGANTEEVTSKMLF